MRIDHPTRIALGLLLSAFVATGPAWAEKPEGKSDKHSQKHAEKAREHAHKRAEKDDKHREKQREREDKRWEKARERDEKQAGKSGGDRHGDARVGGYFDDRHRDHARTYYSQHYGDERGCPPGLAKKNNGCMPPGQAKKYRMGQPLPREVVYYAVPQPVLVQLPPVPVGYRYVRVGNDILLLSPRSTLVVDVIVNIFG